LLPISQTPLAFSLLLKPQYPQALLTTLGDASRLLSELTPAQRELWHWRIAIGSLNYAVQEPRYIKTATLSLQTALVLDRMLRDEAPPPAGA
jgi:hypothetical protein